MAQKIKHIYFTNRKEYYRRKKISQSLKLYYRTKKIYFVNFEIEYTNGYVQGSLSSPTKIDLEEAKEIIKKRIKKEFPKWKPIEFYEAEDFGVQRTKQLKLFREEVLVLNVEIK